MNISFVVHVPKQEHHQEIFLKPVYRLRGVSLIYTLILLVTISILTAAMSQLLINHQQLSLQSHWNRAGQALVDGAIEMAVNHADTQGATTTLTADCEGGSASAQITPISGSEVYQVILTGKVFSYERLRAETHEEIILSENQYGLWRIQTKGTVR